MTRLDLEEDVYSNVINDTIKGFPNINRYKVLTNNYTYGTILKGMQYRPDKIAEYYLGNSDYAWAIFFANGFTEGIKELRLGRRIKIPNLEML